jgi:hypothetical protein
VRAFGRVVSVVDGVREFAQPVRRPTVQDQAVAPPQTTGGAAAVRCLGM